MVDTLPRDLSPRLLEFCRSIAPDSAPRFVPSRPGPDARFGECFNNVARRIEHDGGSVAPGWAVWHLRGLVFEAEHHGVWRNGCGELIDVSPQVNAYPTILFLPDDRAVYDPHCFRGNLVCADNDDPRALQFVHLTQELYAIRARYRVPGTAVTIGRFSETDRLRCDLMEAKCRELVEALGIEF